MKMTRRTPSLLCAALAGLSCLLTVVPVAGFQPNVPVAFVAPLEGTAMDRACAASISTESSSEASSSFPQLQQSAASRNLPPVIQQIADNRAEFQLNLGRAMDTLRRDMPEILTKTPDFSIYDEEISVIDPSGVQLTGLDKYQSAFAFLQTFHRFWFKDSGSSGVQYRMVYDFCRSSIRISWHVVLYPKVPIGRPFHVDGISYYQLHPDTGKINEHKLERLVINQTPATPPYGIWSLLQQHELLGMARGGGPQPQPRGVPAGVGLGAFQ